MVGTCLHLCCSITKALPRNNLLLLKLISAGAPRPPHLNNRSTSAEHGCISIDIVADVGKEVGNICDGRALHFAGCVRMC
jgi:hypothetical protein